MGNGYAIPRTWTDDEYVWAPQLSRQVTDNLWWLLHHSTNPAPAARVRSTVPVALASGVWSALVFDTAEINRGGMWASGSPLVIEHAGRYKLGAAVDMQTAACNKAIRLIVNGSRVLTQDDRPGVGSPVPGRWAISTTARLEPGDFVEVEAWHDFGSIINAVPGTWAPVLWGRWKGL